MSASWGELEQGAPELARLGRERLERFGVALLGTLRADGSPRISAVEPHLVEGELLFAAMRRTPKLRDLRRDSRCVLHTAVDSPDSGDGELKLHGRALDVEDKRLRAAPAAAWWVGRPEAEAIVFTLAIDKAVFVVWDLERGLMRVLRWSPARGADEVSRPYP